MRNFAGTSPDPQIKDEAIVLLRNAPILISRRITMVEAGLSLAVFLYWRLGYDELSRSERDDSALFILNDCAAVLHVLFRRLLAGGAIPPSPMGDVQAYINSEIEQVDSMWGAINQVSHIFAESYLVTIGCWPVQSSWEKMPRLAHLAQREFCESIYLLVRDFCSLNTAEAILPADVIRASDGPEGYGKILSSNFLVRQRSQRPVTSTNSESGSFSELANEVGKAAGGIASFGLGLMIGAVEGLFGTNKRK